jgi:D-threo-aldose 1-dehydrogenase
VQLGRLGLGTAPLGNLYAAVSDADAAATLAAAQRHGIRWFDTAPLYGHGLAEMRLGNFVRRGASPRHVVSTKVGRVLEPVETAQPPAHFVAPLPYQPVFDYTRTGIERSFEESLRRLGLERIELLLLHDVDRLTHSVEHRAVVRRLFDEALPTMHRLKADGRVDAIGLGINQWDIGYEILASAEIDCVLLAGRHTLLDQTAFTSGFLDACHRRNVSVLAGGVFNSGLLAGGSTYDYCPADAALVRRRDELAALCSRHSAALPAAALQFTSAHPAITSLVVGARSVHEIDSIVEWSRAAIPPALWDELRARGLIPHDVPAQCD